MKGGVYRMLTNRRRRLPPENTFPLSVCSRRVRLENKAAQAGQGRIKMLPAKYRNAPARGGCGILY